MPVNEMGANLSRRMECETVSKAKIKEEVQTSI